MSRKLTYFYTSAFIFSMCALIYLWFSLNTQENTQLKSILDKKEIRVSILNSSDNYYTNGNKILGLEYELIKALAQDLDVSLKISLQENLEQLNTDIANRDSHISIPGYSVSTNNTLNITNSISYQENKSVIVYRVTQGIKYPRGIVNIIGREILVAANSPQQKHLKAVKNIYPELQWKSIENETTYEILEKIITKKSEIAVISHLDFKKLSPFFPGLKAAFELPYAEDIHWLLANKKDRSLVNYINNFLARNETKQLINELEEKYFFTSNPLGFNDTLSFKKHYTTRFLELEPWFKEAAKQTNIDWILLASIAYQESHWNPKAVSPTGVKGIMMLTKAAAKEVNVSDRTDPKQSIFGGAQYLKNVKSKIPKRITEPDKTFLALAGYNVGFGHLEDARILTKRYGFDPDSWEDVSKHLPLLTKPKFYKTVKHGYARGYEPVKYVKNIQEYLKVLAWEIQQTDIIANKKDGSTVNKTEKEVKKTHVEDTPSAL